MQIKSYGDKIFEISDLIRARMAISHQICKNLDFEKSLRFIHPAKFEVKCVSKLYIWSIVFSGTFHWHVKFWEWFFSNINNFSKSHSKLYYFDIVQRKMKHELKWVNETFLILLAEFRFWTNKNESFWKIHFK